MLIDHCLPPLFYSQKYYQKLTGNNNKVKCSKTSRPSNEDSTAQIQVKTSPEVLCNSKTAHSRTGCAIDETVSKSESSKEHSGSSKKTSSMEDNKGQLSWMDFKLKRNRSRVLNDGSVSSSSQDTSKATTNKYARDEMDRNLDFNHVKLRHCNVLVRKLSPSDIKNYCRKDTDLLKRKKESSQESKARNSVMTLSSDDEDDLVLSKRKKESTQEKEMEVTVSSSNEEVGMNLNEWVVTSATGTYEDSDRNSGSEMEDNSRCQELSKSSRIGGSANYQNEKTGCSSSSKGKVSKSVEFSDSKPIQSCEKKIEHFNENLGKEEEKLEPKKVVEDAPAKIEDQDQTSNDDSCDELGSSLEADGECARTRMYQRKSKVLDSEEMAQGMMS